MCNYPSVIIHIVQNTWTRCTLRGYLISLGFTKGVVKKLMMRGFNGKMRSRVRKLDISFQTCQPKIDIPIEETFTEVPAPPIVKFATSYESP